MSRPLFRVLVVLLLGSLSGLAGFRLFESSPSSATSSISTTTTSTSRSVAVVASAIPPAPPSTTADPIEEPAEPERGWLVIQGTGDVNFDPGYIPNLASHGYGFAFEGLAGIFEGDDLTVVNLECSPSPLGSELDKTFTFRCDPDALPIARAAGVDVANLANNHGQDYGPEAMLDGRQRVIESGIAAVGVGENLEVATRPALFQTHGWTIAVLGMGGVVPSDGWLAAADRPGMASGDDLAQMVAAVRAADEVADLVVVSIHWGRELHTEPDADDVERARAIIEAGADVIFGHHPHRLGELSTVEGRPVFWTLGNFIWPRLSDAGSTTAIARVVISPDGDHTACLIPAFIEQSGHPVLRGDPPCDVPAEAPDSAE